MYSFKDGFKRARKARNLTQEKFCEKFTNYDGSKLSLPTVRNWEQGRNVPELKTIVALCTFFSCDMDYLFFNIDCRTHDNSFINQKLGLSEYAIDYLIEKKHLGEHYIAALNMLLACDNFDSVLSNVTDYVEHVKLVDAFIKSKKQKIESLESIDEYKPNPQLDEMISEEQKRADLTEFRLSQDFSFTLSELSRKARQNK